MSAPKEYNFWRYRKLHKYKFGVIEGMLREDQTTECNTQWKQDIFTITTKTHEMVHGGFILSHIIAQKSPPFILDMQRSV